MTRLQRLYETADGLGLQICYFPMENNTAISTPDGFIGMDVDRLENSAGELECLAHEMGTASPAVFIRWTAICISSGGVRNGPIGGPWNGWCP